MTKVPSIGRTVHFVTRPASVVHYPAVVIVAGEADSQIACLRVFTPTGDQTRFGVPYDPTGQEEGTWHWPEYVPEVDDAST